MTARSILAGLSLVLGACGASAPTTAQTNASSPGAGTGGPPFTVTEVMDFSTPWAMDFLPGSGLRTTSAALVSERDGRLWLVNVATGERRQVTGVPDVHVAGQGGLGDVVAHPGFAANRRIYLSFAEAGPDATSGAALGYGTLVLGEGQPRLDDFRIIWRQQPKVSGNGHFAHRIAFAPDGTIFLTSGDRQKMEPAQDPNSDLGKIIHLTDEGQVAPGGPWVGRGERLASYWTMGHRNPLGLAIAPDGRLWSVEMGPEGGDELNLIVRGRNYGWPRVSYGSHYGGAAIPDDHKSQGFEEPKLWWNPAISPGGLLIYTGDLFPGWRGDALIGALSGRALIRVDLNGDRATKADQWDMGARIRAVDQGPDGAIYLLEDGREPSRGRLLKLTPAS